MTTETYPNTVKICVKCDARLPLDQFYKKKDSKDGHENACIPCRRKQMSARDKERYDSCRRRSEHLWRSYLINQSIYEHIFLMQGGCCAVCGSTESGRSTDQHFVVDHCHDSGKVRGLLCHPCNTALGLMKDNATSLQNAITYLSEHA